MEGLSGGDLLHFVEVGGWPAVCLLLGLYLIKRLMEPKEDRKPWVFRVELAFSQDTLVRLAALAKRILYSRRERPDPGEEASDDPVTPEVVVQPGRRRG